MEELDICTALHLKQMKDENLDKKLDEINKVKSDVKELIKDSYREGFLEGREFGKKRERVDVKGKIVSNLIVNTDMNDEEIFDIVALDEWKWMEHIKCLRSEYEKGLSSGKEKFKEFEDEKEE